MADVTVGVGYPIDKDIYDPGRIADSLTVFAEHVQRLYDIIGTLEETIGFGNPTAGFGTISAFISSREDPANKSVANGYASLDAGGKVPLAELPSVVIGTVTVYADEAAMIADSASLQEGDFAIATAESTTWIHNGGTAGTIADFNQIVQPPASETVAGVVELATQAETDTGTDDQRAITPLKLTNFSGFNGMSQIKITSNDTTADFLFNKVTADTGISLTEINDGGDEDLQIGLNLGAIDHDSLLNFLADEHLDWTTDLGADNMNDANIIASNITQHEGSINHDNLFAFVANEHLDWTADLGATNMNDGNITASNVTQHVGSIDHDSLLNYVLGQHRIINDASTSTTELLSASEIDSRISIGAAVQADFVHAYDTTTQAISVGGTPQAVDFATNAELDGWTHTGGTSTFTCAVSARYLVTYRGHVEKTGVGGGGTAEMFAEFNAVEIAGTQAFLHLTSNNALFILNGTFIVDATAAQVLELQFSGNSTSVQITAPAGDATTDISASITITKL